ncbi:hypothetical protein OCU04_005747 [Sclerotinia nivalis]|uniref:Uncharacterized protein n=1 Tax=Sclerotinia nivalis TaxID=352851 RepID=A0A9X0ALK9_9HELO|nr:hypothetical protein OCU04_005747 [Sclerotinia nivalis]
MVRWGVLQDQRYPNTPGTANLGENTAAAGGSCEFIEPLIDLSNTENVITKGESWDYVGPKKRNEIVLNPQPSESLNDLLNWSTAVKMAVLFILGPMVTTCSVDVATAFGVSTDQVSFNIIGVMQLTTGSGTFFTAAAVAAWENVQWFIISTIDLSINNIWGYYSDSLMSLSIMQAVQGLCASPLQTDVSATDSEIFFVHEKGKMLRYMEFVMNCVKFRDVQSFMIAQIHHFQY